MTYTYGTTPANFDVGRLTGVTRNGSTVGYAYDRFGRTLADGSLTYTYDNNGNPLTIAYPGTLQAIYTYDKMNRPISLQSKEGAAAAVYVVKNSPAPTYKAYGPLNTLVFNTTTNRTETRNFDFRYQPTGVTLSGSILTWTIAVDAAGNVTQQQRTAPAPTETRTYGYQGWQYYLASGAGPWSGSPLSWTYDKIGNRMSETRGGLTDGYVYTDNSGSTGDTALLDVVNLGVGGTRDYTFDGGGYLGQISAGANVLAYTFDAAGELASVVRGAQSLTNTYDGRGFLSQASDATSGGYVKPTYSSQGLLLSQERLPTTGGTTERIDVLYFAGRPAAIWKKVGTAAATTTYLTTDQLGAPMFALNPAGTELWKGGFEPFGRDWQEGTANDALTKGIFLRLPGQWDDTLFGNATLGADSYYNVRRWYETQVGRFESADPLLRIRLSRGAEPISGLDLQQDFTYAKSRPLLLVDPLGLAATSSAKCIASKVLGGFLAGLAAGGTFCGEGGWILGPGGAVIAGSTCAVGGGIAGAVGGLLGGASTCEAACSDDPDESKSLREHCVNSYVWCQDYKPAHRFKPGWTCGTCFKFCQGQGYWPQDKCSLFVEPVSI
ncbi:MAG: hypothetical protein U0X73_12255 [Thermoanaerobaculia bacterium]